MVFNSADEGHRTDMAATNCWVDALGLSGWVDWQMPGANAEGVPELSTW
jgi:hypothetical protein